MSNVFIRLRIAGDGVLSMLLIKANRFVDLVDASARALLNRTLTLKNKKRLTHQCLKGPGSFSIFESFKKVEVTPK